jgi:hypothetical protein
VRGQQLPGDALSFTKQADQQVAGADTSTARPAYLLRGQFDGSLHALAEVDIHHADSVALAGNALGLGAQSVTVDAQLAQNAPAHALGLREEAKEQVFGADLLVPATNGLLVSHHQRPPCQRAEEEKSICHV